MYCSVCGDELAPEEELEGICQSCKISQGVHDTADEIEPAAR